MKIIIRNLKNWPPSFAGSFQGMDLLYTSDIENVKLTGVESQPNKIILHATYIPSRNDMLGSFRSENSKLIKKLKILLEKNIGKSIDYISSIEIEY